MAYPWVFYRMKYILIAILFLFIAAYSVRIYYGVNPIHKDISDVYYVLMDDDGVWLLYGRNLQQEKYNSDDYYLVTDLLNYAIQENMIWGQSYEGYFVVPAKECQQRFDNADFFINKQDWIQRLKELDVDYTKQLIEP
ncbi:MAG: hypothetical protein JEZ07_13230 [Phycisphaerae bacterium]|nr:hypothetical protein [Phycisphaerae bacterium]